MKIACILAAAFLLDCLLGDPRWLPHPICLIGKLIACTEKGMRRLVKNEFLGGLLLVIVVITVSTAVPWAILFLAGMIKPVGGNRAAGVVLLPDSGHEIAAHREYAGVHAP